MDDSTDESSRTRVALISDIHGNLPALEAVLSSIEAHPTDQIICLGDVAVFGPQPVEVIQRLQELNIPMVMGNTDAWLLNPKPHPYRDEDTHRVSDIEMWAAEQLGPADTSFVRSFQHTITTRLGADLTLLAFHGSPRANRDIIVSTTPEDDLRGMLAGRRAPIMAGGHTHCQMLRRVRETILVNPGSVGQAFERSAVSTESWYCPWAEYALITLAEDELRVDLRRVRYDLEALLREARIREMPHHEWWISLWDRRHELGPSHPLWEPLQASMPYRR